MQAGASVSVKRLSKAYGPVVAVNDVSIDVAGGEFVALLGPSGSGKSTILMSIAGFEAPSAGEILLDGRCITDQPPHRRGIGMVFQRYALFPHLTVAENVAYPLRRRGMDGTTMEREVARALAMVRLDTFGPRYPSQLSGGQQQRVALARALVFHPPVLLMDEPLCALDRKLRQQMQMEIKLLHREIGATIIFVTHDQEEALSMADRIAVLHLGELQQIGTPAALYEQPANAFVADFIGETNFLPAEVLDRMDEAVAVRIDGSEAPIALPKANVSTDDRRALLGIRPEHLRVVDRGQGIPAIVVETAYAGATLSVLLDVGSHRLTSRVPLAGGGRSWAPGQEVGLIPEASRCRLYRLEDAAHSSRRPVAESSERRPVRQPTFGSHLLSTVARGWHRIRS